MSETKINLSENQLKNVAIVHKTNTSVRIRSYPERIKGKAKYKILLNKAQKEKIDESKALNKWGRIRTES